MNAPEPQEIELTPDLLDYARRSAIKEAEKICPPHVDVEDVGSEAVLHLLSKPPKYDPTKGASVKTLLYLVVQRYVLKYNARQCRHASRYKQIVKPNTGEDDDHEEALESLALKKEGRRHPRELRTKNTTTDDVLEFIDDEESREFCRVVMECGGNKSEAARRLNLSEGTIRHRLKLLKPKLQLAGSDPLNKEEWE